MENLYNKSISAVRVDSELTDWFKTIVGVRQGCCLSPYLFNLILEAMIKYATYNYSLEDTGINMYGSTVNNLRFADDIDLIAKSEQDLQTLTSGIHLASEKFGLKINCEKTKTVAISRERTAVNIRIGQSAVEQVEDFVYLGSVITQDGKCEEDIRRRIGKASSVMGRLGKIWKDTYISLETKVMIYEALVKSVFMYGAECWTLRKEDERRILVAEMGWLRKIAGISRRERRRNEDIRAELAQTVTLVDRIQEKRLQWFGHVERMKTDRLPVKALHAKIEGKRSRGRQRKRWIDNVTADIKERGSCMQMAKELVHNREEWRSLTIQPHRRQPPGE